jgi:hypothetical protein
VLVLQFVWSLQQTTPDFPPLELGSPAEKAEGDAQGPGNAAPAADQARGIKDN